jgi:hypothetical protein
MYTLKLCAQKMRAHNVAIPNKVVTPRLKRDTAMHRVHRKSLKLSLLKYNSARR